MKVLYIHPTGAFGGASKSLIELWLNANKLHKIQAVILTPAGTASAAFRKAGMYVVETSGLSQFDHTRYGYYRNLRWIILLREFFFLPFTLLSLLNIRHEQKGIDLIHVNEITLMPTALLAKWLFKLPMIIHIRSVQHPNQQGIRSRIVFKLMRKIADTVICIDETVKVSVPPCIKTSVIHNSISLDANFHVNTSKNSTVKIGMAGVLLRAKGVYELLEAANILVNQKQRNVRFIIAGENARHIKGLKQWLLRKFGFYEDVLSVAKEYVKENGLEQHVIFKGFMADIKGFYQEIDIMCFPSHLNACGRPVFEAALHGIPSIVAIKAPLKDALIDGVTGLAIDNPEPVALSNAIDRLVTNPNLRSQLGHQALAWAKDYYDIEKNASLLWEVYQEHVKSKK